MPDKLLDGEKKYKILIYHGHLHKILLDENKEEFKKKKVKIKEDSIK